VNNRKGLVSNLFIEAGDYYNVYAGECTNPLQYLSGDQQSWEDINSTFNNSDCFYSSSFVSTSSGAIISSQGCRSINQGQTWTNNVNDFISLADIVTVKDEVVYIVEYNNTFWTEDYGLSWNNIQHVEDANIFDAPFA